MCVIDGGGVEVEGDWEEKIEEVPLLADVELR